MTALFEFARVDTNRYPGFPCAWSHTDRHDSTHRFTLWRVWDDRLPYMQVIGLNPSTAHEEALDPTVTRVQRWAQAWGFGAFTMTNLFGFRSPHPTVMQASADPVGADNDHWLHTAFRGAGLVVAAWGNGGEFLDRAQRFLESRAGLGLPELHCLGVTANGSPIHPLARGRHRVPDDVQPILWPVPGS
ncbi:DUF1643 domain-containing protein [Azospirillum sp. SYSU D00513]|uniref:DUF1643 domain-containing protein n=1 Tax=Azospirillum sp. SYSU D00513 TaxID=2812561 RepID=UPI001A967EDC|nr:DUF1643 domain-containing protein [Azospirillum sp. SYSU D00513]